MTSIIQHFQNQWLHLNTMSENVILKMSCKPKGYPVTVSYIETVLFQSLIHDFGDD